MTNADVDDALALIAQAVKQAQADGVDEVRLATTVRGAQTVWLALRTLHRDAPVASLLPGDIAGDMVMSARLGILSELIDRLGPVVVELERHRR